jgi:hypothetical protein
MRCVAGRELPLPTPSTPYDLSFPPPLPLPPTLSPLSLSPPLQVEDKCDDHVGCIIAVNSFSYFSAGRVQMGFGTTVFTVRFQCLVMKPEVRMYSILHVCPSSIRTLQCEG